MQTTKIKQFETVLSREIRQADLGGAASGYGHHKEIYCPEGVPVEQALFALLAAFGASFGFLFRAVTLITGGRRKRSAEGALTRGGDAPPWHEELLAKAADMYWWGR